MFVPAESKATLETWPGPIWEGGRKTKVPQEQQHMIEIACQDAASLGDSLSVPRLSYLCALFAVEGQPCSSSIHQKVMVGFYLFLGAKSESEIR